MLDGMSDSIQRSRIENLHSREVDRQSPTGLIFIIIIIKIHFRNLILMLSMEDLFTIHKCLTNITY